jgi:hypothetical protein
MKAVAADAMQCRALGSRLFERKALEELAGGIPLPDRPLARAEHADAGRPLVGQGPLELLGHHVECFVPGDRLELAILGEDAVALAQQRLRQAVGAVHDLRQEIAFDAVQALIDLGMDVAVRGDDPALLHRDHDTAAGAAEPARRLASLQLGYVARHDDVLRLGGQRVVCGGGGGGGRGCLRLEEDSSCQGHG